MGIIKRQAIKASLVNWVGVALGMLTTLFIVPYTLEAYGIYMFISGVVMLVIPFVTIGMEAGVVKFFGDYKDSYNSNRTLLSLSMVLLLINFFIVLALGYFFKDQVVDYYKSREPSKYQYLIIVVPMILLLAIFSLLTQYISNFERIVVPNIIRNLFKVILPILLLLYLWGKLTMWQFLGLVVLHQVIIIVLLFAYLHHLKELKFQWSPRIVNKKTIGEMTPYLLNGVIISLGAVLASVIDTVMVGSMIDIGESTAIYSIGTLISNVLMMPNNAVGSISAPLIATHWAKNEVAEIKTLYRKSSINLFVVGVLIFVGIWANIDDLFGLMKDGEKIKAAKNVMLYFGLARLFSMASGINGMVIQLSKHFRYNTVAIVVLGLLNVILNYYLIKKYGLVGAAIASAISIVAYNLVINLGLFLHYKIQPFTIKMLWVTLAGVVILYIASWINFENPIISILCRSLFISLIYVAFIYFADISREMKESIDQSISKVLGKK